MLSMRLFKARTKILDYRQLAAKVVNCQANVWVMDLTSLSLGLVSAKVYNLAVMRQAAAITTIKGWIYKSTTIATDVELIFVVYELFSVSNKLKVNA
jgi:hypothetical protein